MKKRKLRKRDIGKVEVKVGVSVTPCRYCKDLNIGTHIYEMFSWGNGLLGYDEEKEEILVNEDALMRIIQIANRVQLPRPIRLVSRDSYYGKTQEEKND